MDEVSVVKFHAPIAVFAYNRPQHLHRCLKSLLANPEARHSDLYIFSDGPRTSQDAEAVREVRELAEKIDGFASVTRIARDRNFGLARSIIDGVSVVLQGHPTLIVIEDDLVLAPYFLRYMNDALDLYADAERVASVHGYCFPVREPLPDTFFLRGADCWGWGTWRRAWAKIRLDAGELLKELRNRNLTHSFDMDGTFPFTQMLVEQAAGRNNSWAIRWHASCFLADMLTLYPGRSLVRNIGNDSSGTHSKTTNKYDVDVDAGSVLVHKISIEPSAAARAAFVCFLKPTYWERIRRTVSAATLRLGIR